MRNLLAMLTVKEIVTKGYITPSKLPGFDYVINPYVGCPHRCIYCYAEYMKRLTSHEEAWGDFLDVKTRSISHKPLDLQGKTILLSSVTDCYNFLEEKYRLTRQLLEQLRHSGAQITILTKSPLVLRDIDILKQIPEVTVGISVSTHQDEIRQQIEPGAPAIQERLAALETLHRAGIRTWLNVAPVCPGLTDWKNLVQSSLGFVDRYAFENLKLRASALHRVLLYITQKQPHLKALYHQIYEENNGNYWHNLRKEILAFCNAHKLSAAVYFSEKTPTE